LRHQIKYEVEPFIYFEFNSRVCEGFFKLVSSELVIILQISNKIEDVATISLELESKRKGVRVYIYMYIYRFHYINFIKFFDNLLNYPKVNNESVTK
jgi:hypothetical protein